MIDKKQLKELVEETLKRANLHTEAAVNLICGTIAQESRMGTFIKQLNNGPALGICQMEPVTERDIWINYIAYKKDLQEMLFTMFGVLRNDTYKLKSDLGYQIVMCRIHYLRVPAPLPPNVDKPQPNRDFSHL